MYKWSGRVRYSEADRSGCLSMQGLLRLFQDVSYLHAQDRGLGVKFTQENRCTWFLLSWQVKTLQMPPLGSKVTVETAFTYLHESLGRKNLWLRTENGTLCAVAETSWAYMNVDRQTPVIAPAGQWWAEDFLSAEECQAIRARDLPCPAFDRGRLRIPPGGILGDRISVEPWMLDTNDHVNNVRLSEIAMIAGRCSVGCRSLRAEFKKQVFFTDELLPVTLTLTSDNGIPRGANASSSTVSFSPNKALTYVQMLANGKEAAAFFFETGE